MNYRRLFVLFALPALFLSTLFLRPASALEFVDYQDYATYDFSDDFANVTVNLPTQQCRWDAYGINYSSYIGTFRGSSFVWSVPTGNYALFVNPFGTSFNVNSNVNDFSSDGFAIKLDDLPKDAVITSVIKISFPDANGLIHEQSSFRNYYVAGDSIVLRGDATGVPVVSGTSFTYSNTFYREDYSGSGDGYLFALSIPDFWVSTDGAVICELEQLSISFSISGLQYQAQQSGKTNQLLEDVKDALADQDKTMDEILSGGSAGDDLMSGSDKLEDAGAGLGNSIGDISDFENAYMGQLDDQLPDILASADLNYLVSPLAFVKMYTDKIVAGVPSQYLLIFTLPALFGIFFYIVGHPIRAPKPDTSGDVVTRETFTTTTVLTGKHAGQTSTVRTVTQSQEIGRVSGASDN